MTATIFSPAKINLHLAVTGRRADGFHNLVSVAAPLDFGDTLVAEAGVAQAPVGGQFTLACDNPAVPVDERNLILKAARAFRAASGWPGAVHFRLQKRIPMGAGLGGGSSNAVAALRALQEFSGGALSEARLTDVAAAVGADCVLFLKSGPVVMRGRGEQVTALPEGSARRLRGRRVLLFKPSFSIRTAWAYEKMAANGRHYRSAPAAEAMFAAWLDGSAPAEELLGNNMEGVVFEKYVALPVMLELLRSRFGVAGRMSGSGSACFALLPDQEDATPIAACIHEGWGPAAFVREARML
ncbi:MAG: 4-(cytidine 5'-diphospho)-2-C-methyl-D-erythritol kinase [Opitutaceae bacterium]|nr:4-(cytidine 5'-diphospho)-2-C-methyl-D-erythritol kinase [Opitutaceae bacterium]